TWSLAAYLSFFVRLIAASFGPWILIAISPGLVASWPAHPWVAAALLTVALFAWNEFYSDVFVFVMRARRLATGARLARFSARASGSRTKPRATCARWS